jgi:hypothetical protein
MTNTPVTTRVIADDDVSMLVDPSPVIGPPPPPLPEKKKTPNPIKKPETKHKEIEQDEDEDEDYGKDNTDDDTISVPMTPAPSSSSSSSPSLFSFTSSSPSPNSNSNSKSKSKPKPKPGSLARALERSINASSSSSSSSYQSPPRSYLKSRSTLIVNTVCFFIHALMAIASFGKMYTADHNSPTIDSSVMRRTVNDSWYQWNTVLFSSMVQFMPSIGHMILSMYHVSMAIPFLLRWYYERELIARRSTVHWVGMGMWFALISIHALVQIGVTSIYTLAVIAPLVIISFAQCAICDSYNSITPQPQSEESNGGRMMVIDDQQKPHLSMYLLASFGALPFVYIWIDVFLRGRELVGVVPWWSAAIGWTAISAYCLIFVNGVCQQTKCGRWASYPFADNIASLLTLVASLLTTSFALVGQPSPL